MRVKTRVIAMLLAVLMMVGLLPLSLFALDAKSAEKTDASESIKAELGSYFKGETKQYQDTHIGIPVDVSILYDEKINIKDGYDVDATPVVIYVINTAIERIGTDSDVNIIQSMLDRGFIVVIFDYLNSEKALSPDLDWSVQGLRPSVTNGTYLSEIAGLNKGNFCNNMVVPAGYNIEFNIVFWEIDKHGADGTLEKIVEIWNNDFRGVKGEALINWADENGNRKATQNGFDGSAPVWYNENGAEDADGKYIKVKHTKAEKIEDCVKADGTPIDLNLYMHVTYPTSPEKDVPVMVLSNSSEHLASGTQTADRPHFSGFLFNGYAAAVFDHGYTPMARNDHYMYFDGSHPSTGSVTGDNTTYSIHFYNENKINTAAMRYLRYLSASNHEKYTFDDTAFGVFGNSKGGWATNLGEEHPELLPERRLVPGYSGESRYEAGKTETVGVIDGGEAQPWLTYNGNALDSGADFVYMGCGGGVEQITENHAPMFISCPTKDSSYYSTVNLFVNACRSLDVPSIWFEINMGHTIASGPDLKYGVETYDALFTFANYYLKDDAVKVIYSHRDAEYSGLPSNAPIVVKFSGPVSKDEIEKVILKDASGNVVTGNWTAQYGNTEWTLNTPTLKGDTEYTLTVPSGIKGDNGKGMAEEHTFTFATGYESASSISSVKTDKGTYFYFTVPSDTKVFDKPLNVYKLRLNVTNDAVNKAEVYLLSGFNASSPDSATVGTKLTTLNVSGAGYYDIDISDQIKSMAAGSTAAFLVKQVNAAGETLNNSNALESELGTVSVYSGVNYSFAETPDGKQALKIESVNADTTTYVNDPFIKNPANLISNNKIIKNGSLTADDLGRTFKISFKVYDTESRIITVKMNSLTSINLNFADYESYYFNYYTKAGEWMDVEFTYTVYEPKYEQERGKVSQAVHVIAPTRGPDSAPLYISDMKSVEIITDVTYGGAELLLGTTEQRSDPLITPYGTIPSVYENADEYPVILFDRSGKVLDVGQDIISADGKSGVLIYTQDSNSTSNFPNNDVIVYVRKDITNQKDFSNLSFQFGNILIDLADNTFTCIGRLFQCQAKRGGVLNITVKNGTVLQKSSSLIYYSSASYSHETVGVREFNFNFENVTLGYAEGATAVSFVQNAGAASYPVKGDVTFTNCTFDLKTNAPSGTVFRIAPGSNSNILTNVYVKGGVIKANALTSSSIVTTGGQNEFKFLKDALGNYTVAELPSTAAAPTGSYKTDGEDVCFTALSTGSGTTTYNLTEDPLWTPYGRIPEDRIDKSEHPFVLFQDNGDGTYTFKNTGKDIFVNTTATILYTARNIKSVIYMRRDYVGTNIGGFENIAYNLNLVFDLGNNILTVGNHINIVDKNATADKHITFKNGTLKTESTSAKIFRIAATKDITNYKFYLVLDNINFVFPETLTYTAPLMYFHYAANANYTHALDIEFNNCTFNIPTVPSGTSFFISGNGYKCTADVRVNGGKLIANSLTNLKLVNAKANSTVTFVKLNGEYMSIECAIPAKYADESVPSYKVTTAEGSKIYAVTSIANGVETYTLITQPSLSTKYGSIPYKYASAEVYPFVLFKDNGDGTYTCIGAEANIFPDASVLFQKARNTTGVILMRRDFVKTTASAHGNICYINKGLIIDLGGFTLTVKGGNAILADAKKVSTVNDITFKNGTVILDNKTFIEFTSSIVPETEGIHTFKVTFDGINFVLSGSASILKYTDYKRAFNTVITFNGCVIDMSAANKNSPVFVAGSEGGNVTTALVVNGGQVIGLSKTQTLVNEQNASSTVRFGEGVSGYTRFIGSVIKSPYLSTDGQTLDLVILTQPDIYVLTPIVSDGITYLYGNNLLLGTDVKVQFYLEIDETLASGAYAEIGRSFDYENGKTLKIPFEELETQVVDGRTYYIISYGVPAKDMAVTVIARLIKNDEVISTEYSYSAQTYIDTVLEREIGGEITTELKALVSALDVYGKNASAVLGAGSTVNVENVDWTDVTSANGGKAENGEIRLSSFSLDLKSNIRFRINFEVTNGASISSYTVELNGSRINAYSVGNNVYCIDYAIVAANLNTPVRISIMRSNGGAEMLWLEISPLYYARVMNEQYEGPDAASYKNLMRSIKNYYNAAVEYQKSLNGQLA